MSGKEQVKYPRKFEDIWKTVKDKRANQKQVAWVVFEKLESFYNSPDLTEQVKEKDKWIKELLNKAECQKCGTTEFLCGHNKRG